MKINILIKKKSLLFWQFKVKIFGEILQICHVQHSFSNTGDPYDNAVIESFFSTFKKEAINGKEFEDIVSLKRAIDNYIIIIIYIGHIEPSITKLQNILEIYT